MMWRCPRCKRDGIRIFEACITVIVFADGCETEEEGYEWDDDNPAECRRCSWKGIAGEAFDESGEDCVFDDDNESASDEDEGDGATSPVR
jgi:hypothetical protein